MDTSKKPEKSNPRKSASFLSHLFLIWIFPVLFKGVRKGLNKDDVPKCLKVDASENLGYRLEKQWHKEVVRSRTKKRKPLLRNAILRTFWQNCIIDGFICFAFMFIRANIPLVLSRLLHQFQLEHKLPANSSKYIQPNAHDYHNSAEGNESVFGHVWSDRYFLAILLLGGILSSCILLVHAELRQKLLGARMRIACCSLIYKKTLRLSKKTADRVSAGYLVNLLSNDVTRLDYGFVYAHWIWILPIQCVYICYLLWQEIQVAALLGILGLLIQAIPLQTGLGKLSSRFRMKVAEITDSRVSIMNELVQGIQVIKMYAWERPFQKLVDECRQREIGQIRYAGYVKAFFASNGIITERLTLLVTFVAIVLQNKPVTAEMVFSMVQYFNTLQLVAAIFYPLAIGHGTEALVSIERIQEYLLLEEQDPTNPRIKPDNISASKHSNAINLRGVSANWDDSVPRATLRGISIDIEKGQLCAIIGPVGTGKTTLLQVILNELPITSGEVAIKGNISYASQEPWLFTGTIQNNILCGESFNKLRYNDITRCCALKTDFEQFVQGDQTVVGERGVLLSGGQKARISLARSLYKKADIYLLDDPLSAVDVHVGKHLFNEIIGPKGYLKREEATRILVTHQTHFLSEADWIVIIEDGVVSRQGTYTDLVNCNLNVAKLLEATNSVDEKPSNEDNTKLYGDDVIPYIDEDTEYPETDVSSSPSDLLLNVQANLEEKPIDVREIAELQAEGLVSSKVWWEYFKAGGNCITLCTVALAMVCSQLLCSATDYFINFWTEQEYLIMNNQTSYLTSHECLNIYSLSVLGVVVTTLLRGLLFYNVCLCASRVLHNKMLESVLYAKKRFFDINPSGRVLNRFSKDMGAVDEYLPRALIEATQNVLCMICILFMVLFLNPSLVVAIVSLICAYILIFYVYWRPSQDLKRLEGICRSPIFSHISATLSGITTIRSRGLGFVLANEFDGLQDVHSAVWQIMASANTALGLWLDCASSAFLSTVAFSFITFQQNTLSGNVGLAISQSMVLTLMVQYGFRVFADATQHMTNVERVLQYTDLEQERIEKTNLPDSWPTSGKIEFKDVCLRYSPTGESVLKHLNIFIKSGWKVGIVGRTGAGKTSLIDALFRLSYIEGQIYIDDIDTGVISLQLLRSKMSIIPQDPVLFSATIRYNLDPFSIHSDADLWNALEQVELKSIVSSLDFVVTERGNNFSIGQRQLLCLARAILRNNKLLVLDEATANVDPQTDALIQCTIREKFKDCTVLTIAHRLNTVMESDRILVMEAGEVKEFDYPHILLSNPNGALSRMVEMVTKKDSGALKKLAHDYYEATIGADHLHN